MQVKKIIKMVSGLILLASFGSAFAMNVTCPSADAVRTSGSQFSYVYNTDKDYNWALISTVFNQDGVNWQTVYRVEMVGVIEADVALALGQREFNISPLLAQPAMMTTESGRTTCSYTTSDVKYTVTVVTPAQFGIKS